MMKKYLSKFRNKNVDFIISIIPVKTQDFLSQIQMQFLNFDT